MKTVRRLHDGWSLKVARAVPCAPDAGWPIPAVVPGCVHTDLLAAGLIADPDLDDSAQESAWVGRCDWRYTTDLVQEPDGFAQHDLVFEGLDTIAEVDLNGTRLDVSVNMHRTFSYDVTDLLREGTNSLQVTFRSAWDWAEGEQRRLGPLPGPYPTPFNFVRKMAASFGWDWAPPTVTAGMWRPVGLVGWSTARLGEVRPQVWVDGPDGTVRVIAEVVRAPGAAGDLHLRLAVRGHGVSAAVEATVGPEGSPACLEAHIAHVRRWWPHDMGDQSRYELTLELRDGRNGALLDRWHRLVGFRDIRLDTREDGDGQRFEFHVGGQPVFVRGVNWIPDDLFVSSVGRDRYRERLRQARDAGVTLVRVWGGGTYESDEFYDACDDLGLMVWQDFLFACAAYPEDEPFASEVDAEARGAVVRLMHHPSLVVWNGNNENFWGWADWGWPEQVGERGWGAGYYLTQLARTVAELDPTRDYWPGSPWAGSFDHHPNDEGRGPSHEWDVWNTLDYTAYRERVPRFVAEFGYQAPPTWATLTRAVHDDPMTSTSPGVAHRQKADDGDTKLARGLQRHFAPATSFDDWLWLTQVNQARALQTGVEHYRSHRGRCMGAMWWQLNDCWPGITWSVVDGDGRLKPSWYAMRRSYAPRLLTIQPRDGGLAMILVNDGLRVWRGRVEVTRRTLQGPVVARSAYSCSVAPFSRTTVPLGPLLATPADPASEVLVATMGDQRAWWWFLEDRDLWAEPARFTATVTPTVSGYRVEVVARTLLRDLCLFVDRLDPDAVVDEMFITALPGETVGFEVATRRPLDPTLLTCAPVLRCVGDSG